MSLKSIVRELKEIRDGLSSSSRRANGGGGGGGGALRCPSLSLGYRNHKEVEEEEECGRASLPPELLLDIMERVEATEVAWPARRSLVSCSSVCRSWRDITREVVKTPEECGRITFPISLKQPGPRDFPMQCFIRRERATSTFRLYLGLSPSIQGQNDKLLLVARKIRRATSTDFVISLSADDFSRSSSTYIGKLRSNFLGTKFTVNDSQPPEDARHLPSSRSSRRIHSKQVSPRIPAGNYNIATVAYELNVLRTRGPRRMRCTLHSIPVSSIQEGGTAPTPTAFIHSLDHFSTSPSSKSKDPIVKFSSTSPSSKSKDRIVEFSSSIPNGKDTIVEFSSSIPEGKHSIVEFSSPIPKGKDPIVELSSNILSDPVRTSGESLVLKNKTPRWHEQLQCWCLNFRGRVTVASVKNFQLEAAVDASHKVPSAEQEKVILQFGKIGKDIFTMDYRYPLSAFQAFAICLSSFDTKPVCE